MPRGAGWPIVGGVARVAQLDRASASGAEGCGFDPRLAHQPSLCAALRATARHASLRNWLHKRTEPHSNVSLEARRMQFFYVYILQSEKDPETFYVGFTEDLRSRLPAHNSGSVPHTAKSRPWRIKTAIAFTDRERALEFERYLKSASGRAFAKKRL